MAFVTKKATLKKRLESLLVACPYGKPHPIGKNLNTVEVILKMVKTEENK